MPPNVCPRCITPAAKPCKYWGVAGEFLLHKKGGPEVGPPWVNTKGKGGYFLNLRKRLLNRTSLSAQELTSVDILGQQGLVLGSGVR